MVRRITLLVLLTWGALTHVATVYACESDNGKKQISCCCDTSLKKDCNKNKPKSDNRCANPGNIVDLDNSLNQNISLSTDSTCCEISYGVTNASVVSSNSSTTNQVLLLDAPQPPPLLPYYLSTVFFHNVQHTLHYPSLTANFSHTNTFLKTHRLRI